MSQSQLVSCIDRALVVLDAIQRELGFAELNQAHKRVKISNDVT